jgi:hypothetical protein
MTVLAKASNNCKRQTHLFVREGVKYGLKLQVFSWKNYTGLESQGACCQDELFGSKPPVIK